MTPEGKVKALVKRRMREAFPGCYSFMPVQNGMGAPALDFFYCVHGRFFAIETKKPGGKPTDRQVTTMSLITQAGGLCFTVDGEQSMEAAIQLIRLRCGFVP